MQNINGVDAMQEVKVDPEFASIIPPLSGEELSGLKESILRDGCRDPLVVWTEKGVILDGHHRYHICTEADIPFITTGLSFPDRAAAMAWVIQNQFARRNLTPFQRAELALKLQPIIKASIDRLRPLGLKRPEGEPKLRTNEILGKTSGLSRSVLSYADWLSSNASESDKAKLRSGEESVCGLYRRLRDEESWQDRQVLEIERLTKVLKAIAAYERAQDESPSQVIDKLQDMAARALDKKTKEAQCKLD